MPSEASIELLIAEHMSKEEIFQAALVDSLKDTAASLATLAEQIKATREAQGDIRATVNKIDGKIDDHEKRLSSVERTWNQAATIAKWFFGGGFLAFCAAAYAIVKLIDPIRQFLEQVNHK